MDTKLLLVNIITLLYIESIAPSIGSRSNDMAIEALSHVKISETTLTGDFGRDAISALHGTAVWMTENPSNYTYDKTVLLQRLKLNSNNDHLVYDVLKEVIDKTYNDEVEVTKTLMKYREDIREHISKVGIAAVIKKHNGMLMFQPNLVDYRNIRQQIYDELLPYEIVREEAVHPGRVTTFRTGDKEGMAKLYEKGLTAIDPKFTIKFGLQGLNRMFGPAGGGRRGELVVISALQHNGKSSTAIKMFESHAIYNKPVMLDDSKTPLLYRLSLENAGEGDAVQIYRSLAENEYRIAIDPKNIDPVVAAEYVTERLERNGYKVIMEQYDPSMLTYRDLIAIFEEFIAKGYEIHQASIDYLAMINKKGLTQGPHGVEIRDLYRRIRNYVNKKSIFTVTPHQLSSDAKKLVRSGLDDFVQQVASKGYWDSCSTIEHEVDVEIYQHIVKVNGESYMTFQRGKHRGFATLTRPEDLYFVYKMHDECYYILDDYLGEDQSRRMVGARTRAEGGDNPWWSNSF